MNRIQSTCLTRITECFEILGKRRRRYALYYLRRFHCANLEELADHIATVESRLSPAKSSEQLYRTVATDLHHVHLPKLADMEVVSYDTQRRVIRSRELPTVFDRILHWCASFETGYRAESSTTR